MFRSSLGHSVDRSILNFLWHTCRSVGKYHTIWHVVVIIEGRMGIRLVARGTFSISARRAQPRTPFLTLADRQLIAWARDSVWRLSTRLCVASLATADVLPLRSFVYVFPPRLLVAAPHCSPCKCNEGLGEIEVSSPCPSESSRHLRGGERVLPVRVSFGETCSRPGWFTRLCEAGSALC